MSTAGADEAEVFGIPQVSQHAAKQTSAPNKASKSKGLKASRSDKRKPDPVEYISEGAKKARRAAEIIMNMAGPNNKDVCELYDLFLRVDPIEVAGELAGACEKVRGHALKS
ncbi:hypothetical protein [Methylobacterium sp. WSM2598]|uniref:hypothetical protein n=1 Tax=Methylobacterium sp. WSM2598 TaxID=398261 RepID=UPI0012F6AFF8|nr:hypothetical protein [Methylobacterium sp. WSM2598]